MIFSLYPIYSFIICISLDYIHKYFDLIIFINHYFNLYLFPIYYILLIVPIHSIIKMAYNMVNNFNLFNMAFINNFLIYKVN